MGLTKTLVKSNGTFNKKYKTLLEGIGELRQ